MLCLGFCSQAKQTDTQRLRHLELYTPLPQKKWQTLREVRRGRGLAFPGPTTSFSLIPFQIVCKAQVNFCVSRFKINMVWWFVCVCVKESKLEEWGLSTIITKQRRAYQAKDSPAINQRIQTCNHKQPSNNKSVHAYGCGREMSRSERDTFSEKQRKRTEKLRCGGNKQEDRALWVCCLCVYILSSWS